MSDLSPASLVALAVLATITVITGGATLACLMARRVLGAGALSLLLASFIGALGVLLSTDRVASSDELKQVELGWPFVVVVQNQERLSPPFPYVARWLWEASSNDPAFPQGRIRWQGIAMTFLLWITVLVLAASLLALIRRPREPR